MPRLLDYFFRGLIVLAPAAVTIWVFWLIIRTVDEWLGFGIPGAGIVVAVALITAFGFLTTSVLASWVVGFMDTTFAKLPLARLVYSSTRDLLDAFVGEKRRFDRPVLVSTGVDGVEMAFGFITQDSMTRFGLEDHVTVYLPFSYTFTGVIRVYPARNIRPLTADSAEVMAFVVSGGVTDAGRKPDN